MKFYFHDWNNIFTEIKARIPKEDIVLPADADVIVMYADTRGPLKEMAERAKMMGKKVYVLQHGRAATRDYDKPLGAKLIADKFLTWGKSDFNRMEKLGYGDRTVIVGCPLLNKIRSRVEHEEKNVLFVPVNADHEQPENIVVYYELLKANLSHAQKILKDNLNALHVSWDYKRKNGVSYNDIGAYTLIAKILPSHSERLYHGNVIKTSPGAPDHMDQLFELLSNVDCVVGMDESTTEILAMAAGVPVVVCDYFEWTLLGGENYAGVERIRTLGADHVDLPQLSEAVNYALGNPHVRDVQREFVVDYELGTNIKDPIHNILKEIGVPVKEPEYIR